MATLKRLKNVNIGTGAVILLSLEATSGPAANIVWNIPRLYLTNITAGVVNVTVAHVTGGVSCRLAFARPVAVGDALVLENIVLQSGDSITVTSNTATSIDAFGSIDEEAA